MKKIGLLLGALVMVLLISSCSSNHSCPAYSDNTVEAVQNV